jgi:ABC-type enterochelin transport system substrate-binding protein
MEQLKEEYSGLGLTDEQIIVAKCYNITPEQIIIIRKSMSDLTKSFQEAWENINRLFKDTFESEEFQNMIKAIQNSVKEAKEENVEFKRNTKGKMLKPWEKDRFFN